MRNRLAWQTGTSGILEAQSELSRASQTSALPASCALSMKELVASIAHEVNQPLAAIVANAEACLSWLGAEQPDVARARKAAQRIVRDGYHASDVLGCVRALLKGNSPAMSKLDLNGVIRDIFELMRYELSRYDVVLQIDLCRQLRPVLGNRIQLQQVMVNLIKNAIESMSESVVRPLLVRVSTAIHGEFAVVAVEDFGRGFDAVEADRMFEPFFTTKREGTGIGLSICRTIIEAHGGLIRASRKEPQGSVFEFTVRQLGRPYQ